MKLSKSTELHLSIQYAEKLLDPELWIKKAEELLAAAQMLEPEVKKHWDVCLSNLIDRTNIHVPTDLQGPYFMLIAYALENLCKAALIRESKEKLRNKIVKQLPKKLEGHNLLDLVNKIELPIDVQEEGLLVRLSHNSVWAGRYPVPMKLEGLHAIKQLSGGNLYFTAYFGKDDIQKLNSLVCRVKTHIENWKENST